MLDSINLVSLADNLSSKLNDPSVKSRILSNSDSIISSYNSNLNSGVNSLGNSLIDNSKNNGLVNNLDIGSGKVQPTQVSNILQDNASDVITTANEDLISTLQSHLPEYSVNEISAHIGDEVSQISTNATAVSISTFSNDIFTANPIESLFNSISSGISSLLDRIEFQFTSGIASTAKTLASKFNISSKDNQDKLKTTKVGFTDPTATYPTATYANKTDTNKLATGDINGTIVIDKEKDRITGSKLPNGKTWEMPTSAYNAKYPYNTVMQTQSGHIIEYDDTPGSERINIHHKSGSYLEIDPNGTTIQRSKGSKYDITDKNSYISIGGDSNISIGGSLNVYIAGDFNAEVSGNYNLRCENDISLNAGGTLNLSANESIDIHSKNVTIEADNEFHLRADVKAFITSEVMRILSNKDFALESKSSLDIKSSTLSIESSENANIKSNALLNIQSTKKLSLKTSDVFAYDSMITQANMGVSSNASSAKPSESAEYSGIGIGDPRVDNIPVSIPEPYSRNFLDKYATLVETSSDNYAGLKTYLITNGLVSYETFNKTPIIANSDSSGYAGVDIIIPSAAYMSSAPDSYQISPNFTLADVSSKTYLNSAKLAAIKNKEYDILLSNLILLTINVLEPIYAVYPDLEILSAFNINNEYQVDNPHYNANAVSFQFKDQDINDYYKIALNIKKLIPYNIFSLHYSTYANKPWMFVSLYHNGNLGLTETWFNNKKITDNISELT